jgi:hypothetical protein
MNQVNIYVSKNTKKGNQATIYMKPDIRERIQKVADEDMRSLSWMISRLCEEALEHRGR